MRIIVSGCQHFARNLGSIEERGRQTANLVRHKDELVGKQTLQNRTRLVTNANDSRVVDVIASAQLITDRTGNARMDGTAQTTIGCHRNKQLLRLVNRFGDLRLFVEVLRSQAVRTGLL